MKTDELDIDIAYRNATQENTDIICSQQKNTQESHFATPKATLPRDTNTSFDLHNEFVRKRMALRQPCHTHSFTFANSQDPIEKSDHIQKAVLVERNANIRAEETPLPQSELAKKILAIQRGDIYKPPFSASQSHKISSPVATTGSCFADRTMPTSIRSSQNDFYAPGNNVSSNILLNSRRSSCFDDNTSSCSVSISDNPEAELAKLKDFEAQAFKDFAKETLSQITGTRYQGQTFNRASSDFRAPMNHVRPPGNNTYRETNFQKRKRNDLLERARTIHCTLTQSFKNSHLEAVTSNNVSRNLSYVAVRVLPFSSQQAKNYSKFAFAPCVIVSQNLSKTNPLFENFGTNNASLDIGDKLLVNFLFQLPGEENGSSCDNSNVVCPGTIITITCPCIFISSSEFLNFKHCSNVDFFKGIKAAITAIKFSIKHD